MGDFSWMAIKHGGGRSFITPRGRRHPRPRSPTRNRPCVLWLLGRLDWMMDGQKLRAVRSLNPSRSWVCFSVCGAVEGGFMVLGPPCL